MGVPVGVGAKEPSVEEKQQEIENRIQAAHDDEMLEEMVRRNNDSGGYTQTLAPGDKARIVQFINTNQPWKVDNVTKEITEGEIPPELFFNFFGWLAHNSSMSNLAENELKEEEINLDIQELEVMMAMRRQEYTPQVNSWIRNAKHLAKLRLYQNRDGGERYLSAAEIQEDLKMYKIMKGKQPSKMKNAWDRVRGRGE